MILFGSYTCMSVNILSMLLIQVKLCLLTSCLVDDDWNIYIGLLMIAHTIITKWFLQSLFYTYIGLMMFTWRLLKIACCQLSSFVLTNLSNKSTITWGSHFLEKTPHGFIKHKMDWMSYSYWLTMAMIMLAYVLHQYSSNIVDHGSYSCLTHYDHIIA